MHKRTVPPVHLLMVLAALFWSGAFIAGKIAVLEFSPFALTFLRFLIALPFIFVLLRIREPQHLLPRKGQWVPLITLGIIGTFGYHALFFSSLKYTTAINSSLIGATNPMVTTLLAILFFGEKVTASRVLGILLSFTGVFLIITNGDLQILTTFKLNRGDLLMFLAVWCWATYAVLSRRFMQKFQLTPLITTTYTFLVCVVVSLPLFLSEQSADLTMISWMGWLAILYMAIFASVLGYLFQLLAIQQIGAAKASIFINLVPIFTIIQSLLFLHEPFGIMKLLNAGMIIIGVYFAARPDR